MAKRRTWLWILAGVLGVGVLFIIAIAGFGVYFVTSHVKAGHSSSTEAFQAFDEARAQFKDPAPLFEVDRHDEPKMRRRLEQMPTGSRKAETMMILAWDPDRERLARVSMPFWMLRLGKSKIDLTTGGFDFERVQLDIEQLERVGPIVLFDHRPQTGQRVLVWTQ